jgi:hypothetical protein
MIRNETGSETRRSGYESCESTRVRRDIYTTGHTIDVLPLVYKMMIPLSPGHARANLTRTTQIRLVSDIASYSLSMAWQPCPTKRQMLKRRSTVHGSSRQALSVCGISGKPRASVKGPRALLWGRQCQCTAGGVRQRHGARRTPSDAALRGSDLVCGGGHFSREGPGDRSKLSG